MTLLENGRVRRRTPFGFYCDGGTGDDYALALTTDGTNIYVAAKDSKLLQRISGSTVTTVRAMTSPMFDGLNTCEPRFLMKYLVDSEKAATPANTVGEYVTMKAAVALSGRSQAREVELSVVIPLYNHARYVARAHDRDVNIPSIMTSRHFPPSPGRLRIQPAVLPSGLLESACGEDKMVQPYS